MLVSHYPGGYHPERHGTLSVDNIRKWIKLFGYFLLFRSFMKTTYNRKRTLIIIWMFLFPRLSWNQATQPFSSFNCFVLFRWDVNLLYIYINYWCHFLRWLHIDVGRTNRFRQRIMYFNVDHYRHLPDTRERTITGITCLVSTLVHYSKFVTIV